ATPGGRGETGELAPQPPRDTALLAELPPGPPTLPFPGHSSPAPEEWERRRVRIDQIIIDPELQLRVAINEEAVEEYAEAKARGDKFPRPRLVEDSAKRLYLVAGRHRLESDLKLGAEFVDVLVTKGEREYALWLAIAENKDHGLRRTNADKARALKAALAHPRAKG